MRKTALIAPIIALIAGASAFFIRSAELSSVLDPVSGLAVPNAPVTILLAVLSAAAVLAFAGFSAVISAKRTAPCEYADIFAPSGGSILALFCTLGAVWLAAAVRHAVDLHSSATLVTSELILVSLSALSGVSLILFAILSGGKARGSAAMLFSVVPVLFMCFWLIMTYKNNASNPVLISFCYQTLAIIFAALSFYYNAGFLFNKPAPAKMLACSLCAVYFCCIVLADPVKTDIKAVYTIAAAVAFIRAVLLINNLDDTKTPLTDEL